jgi:hypothetical protein
MAETANEKNNPQKWIAHRAGSPAKEFGGDRAHFGKGGIRV